ncbi:hypothetical protein AB0C84_45675 [Actinomadura sp. NPDC048955]|uniref:hypothetical protein n=1 Tax=Actinomadura sp. NPDC048955 TaxID=3158228 RepID=UPI003402AEE3
MASRPGARAAYHEALVGLDLLSRRDTPVQVFGDTTFRPGHPERLTPDKTLLGIRQSDPKKDDPKKDDDELDGESVWDISTF